VESLNGIFLLLFGVFCIERLFVGVSYMFVVVWGGGVGLGLCCRWVYVFAGVKWSCEGRSSILCCVVVMWM